MLPIRNINPGMIALIMLSLYNSKFGGKKYGSYFISIDDFNTLISERDMTISENDFMAEIIEWLSQFCLTFTPYSGSDYAVLHVESRMIERFVTPKRLKQFSPM